MNKKIVAFWSLIGLLALPAIALAAFPNAPGLPGSVPDLWTVIIRVLSFLWPIFIGASIIAYIIAGFILVTANGDPSKIKEARSALIWGTAGIVVAMLSFSIPWVIANQLGV